MSCEPVLLTGAALTPKVLKMIADGAEVSMCVHGLTRMKTARRVLEEAASLKQPIYGVTTGLGPKVVETLPLSALDNFS